MTDDLLKFEMQVLAEAVEKEILTQTMANNLYALLRMQLVKCLEHEQSRMGGT